MVKLSKTTRDNKPETEGLLFDSPLFGESLEIPTFAVDSLDNEFEKLKYLAINYDPYLGRAIELEFESKCQALLVEFDLVELLDRPFDLTNRLLQLLDKAEAKLKKAGRPISH